MWVLWIERNDAAFNGIFWEQEQVFHRMWLQLVDYGRNAWFKTQERVKSKPRQAAEYVEQFRQTWCMNYALSVWRTNHPGW